jgi:hypothetical protein
METWSAFSFFAFLQGRVGCCSYYEVSVKSSPALRAGSCPPFAKNAKSGAPIFYLALAI